MKTHKINVDVPHDDVDMAALWEESMQDEDFQFEIKAQSLSVDLVQAVNESGFSQKQIAEHLGWSASRVSRVLHGASNITLRTLFELTSALEIEFDIVFRKSEASRALHYWQEDLLLCNATVVCQKIDEIHKSAQEIHKNAEENLSVSHQILQTAKELNRRSWSRGKSTSMSSGAPFVFDQMAA